jgi:hypothetical protein
MESRPPGSDVALSENANELRESVRMAYSAAADAPMTKHPFPIGALVWTAWLLPSGSAPMAASSDSTSAPAC